MSFPWVTEAQRRKEQADEESANRAIANAITRLHSIRVIRSAAAKVSMSDILKRQREVDGLRPLPSRGLVGRYRFPERSTFRF